MRLRRRLGLFLGLIGISAVLVADAGAQRPVHPVDAATLPPEAAEVLRVWQQYLASKSGMISSRAGERSPLWLESEQRQWPVYDLAGFYVTDGATPEVVSVDRVEASSGPEYRIRTRFRSGGRARASSASTSTMLVVYAVRGSDGWRLANALPRNTRGWRRETIGTITYVHAPGYPFDSARARRAVAFADSLADVFAVPHLDSLTYFLAANVSEMYGIIGVESEGVKYAPDAVGGLAQPVNHQMFSGNPLIGEEYRHELAHLILAPLVSGTSYFVSEGVPTWVGGTSGMNFATAAGQLAGFLAEHPTVSLDSIMSGPFPIAQLYPAAGVLTDMVYEHGGVTAVKTLFRAGSGDELRANLERLLQRPWPTIARDWRQRVMRYR